MPSKANSARAGLDRRESGSRHYNCAHWLGFDLKSVIVENGELTERALATAAWAKPNDIAARKFRSGAIWLGRAADRAETPIGNQDDRHVLLVAGSRAGKGTSAIIPNICHWPGSMLVVDPKGENATIAATRRGNGSDHCDGLEQRVYVLDPFKVARVPDDLRAAFNPLAAINPDDDEATDEAARIADAMVVSQNASDPFWDEQARLLIKGLILYVLVAPHFEGKRSLVTVRRLIMSGDTDLRDDVAEGMESPPSSFEVLFNAMKVTPDFHGIVSGVGETFGNMLSSSGKTLTGILSAAGNHTDFIDSPPMQRILATTTPGFNLAKLKTDPMGISVFLSLPQRFMNTHFRWLRMMVSLTVTEMEKTPGQPASGHRVLMILDEFAGLKRLEVIENAAAQIAGFGVKMFTIVQTLTQLKAIYKDNWEVFIANAGTRMFFSIDDQFTRDYVSKYLGETEVVRTSKNVSKTRGTNSSSTFGTSTSNTTGNSSSSSTSSSQTSGSSSNSSTTSGTSTSMDIGVFWDTARSYSPSSSSSFSSGSSSSSTTGSSSSYSNSNSKTSGESRSQSQGESESETAGFNQAFHKRALLTPDEIGQMFSRIDDEDNPAYPGLALTIVSGGLPMIVRRTNYYADPQFIRCFEPHPDHPFAPLIQPAPQPEMTADQATAVADAAIDEEDVHRKITTYYGQEAVDLALTYHARLSYEQPNAPLVDRSPVLFAKELLDEVADSLNELKPYDSSPSSVHHQINTEAMYAILQRNLHRRHVREMSITIGDARQTKLIVLDRIRRNVGLTDFQEFKYLFIKDKNHLLMLLFGVAFTVALIRKFISLGIVALLPTIPITNVRTFTLVAGFVAIYFIGRHILKNSFSTTITVIIFAFLSVPIVDKVF